ncbi:MAG: extracellular solute-binding protein [Lachnospiraceae bacterium]|nr:extracellular solute-binding protein [Lachnospiraceae bacterium]
MKKGKKILKRSFCVILAAAMATALASCNKNGQGTAGNTSNLVADATDTETAKDSVFRLEKELNIADDFMDVGKIMLDGDRIIFFDKYCTLPMTDEEYESADSEETVVTEEIETDGETEVTEESEADGETEVTEESEKYTYASAWKVSDLDGNVGDAIIFKREYTSEEEFGVEDISVLPDGNLGLLTNRFGYNNNSREMNLVKLSTAGSEISETPVDVKGINNIDRGYVLPDGSVVIYADKVLYCFDSGLKKTGEVRIEELEYLNSVTGTSDGRIFAGYYDKQYLECFGEIFPAENRVEKLDFGDINRIGVGVLHNGVNHLLECNNDKGVLAIDMEGDKVICKLIMDFMESEVVSSTVSGSLIIDDETVLLVGGFDDINPTGIYKKIPADQVKDKKIITMGSVFSTNYQIKKQVLDFNKKNDEYKIRLVDYEQFYNSEDFEAAERQFRNDILSGTGPDIILTANMINPGIYTDKNVFEDLYPYFEKNGINREDYLQNILDAGSKDGKLYQIYPMFSLAYIAVKESVLDGKEGLTMQNLIALEEKYNCKGKGFSGVNQESLLSECLSYSADTYYNISEGKCNFDSEEFINTLKWINEYPKEESGIVDEESYYEYRKQQEIALRKNESLFSTGYLYDLREYNSLKQISFGENVALIGFPGSENNTSGLISADQGFAINAKSEYKDAAFDFIKYFLSEEFQVPQDEYTYSLPIMKKALDKFIGLRMEDPCYPDENGNMVTEKSTSYSYASGKQVEVGNLSEEDAKKVRAFIEGSTEMTNYDRKVIDIVKEESAAYFAGQKSAEDVAAIIQSRVTIYVQENQ